MGYNVGVPNEKIKIHIQAKTSLKQTLKIANVFKWQNMDSMNNK